MQVEILASIAGGPEPARGITREFAFYRGQVVELEEEWATYWLNLASPLCRPVGEKRETAMLDTKKARKLIRVR